MISLETLNRQRECRKRSKKGGKLEVKLATQLRRNKNFDSKIFFTKQFSTYSIVLELVELYYLWIALFFGKCYTAVGSGLEILIFSLIAKDFKMPPV